MWNKWKRKIENILFTETIEYDEEVEEVANQIKQPKPLHTKMMYKYPDTTPFRFPIIPDNKNVKNESDLPAYQRRGQEQKRESRQHSIQNEHKAVKLNKQPFQPTQVASPIYGYHKRQKEQEITNVPAYIRKKKIEENDFEEQQIDIKDNEAATTKEPVNIETDVQSIQIEQPELKEVINEEKAPILNREVEQQKKQSKDKERQNDSQLKQTKRKSRRSKNKRKENRNEKSLNNVPYNVMMTPQDRRNMFRKKKHNVHTEANETIDPVEEAFTFPPHHLLNDKEEQSSQDQLWVENQQQLLEKTLKHFNVDAKVVHATQGPSVTRFEVQPAMGVKVSRVRNLSDDIKLNMAAKDIRIEAPIPGKNTIGIEVPNLNAQMVGLQEIFTTNEFKQSNSPLTIGLGLTIEGRPLITNISKMPHGLIAGATGSGKSVCINTILISLLYKSSYEDVKLLLIDPKMVELAPYNGIPHLVAPVITDVKAATASLKWAVEEMEGRYEKFVKEGVRDIERYNDKVMKEARTDDKMPFIVIVIDELADLMMMAPQEVEDAICRIAQKARACGIHLLVATQRPSVDVITGLIKANIPTRIAFSVSSQVDSRTIIDSNGADKLLGKGDMLFIENGSRNSLRLQGAFVSDEEIERVTNHARSMAPPNYLFEQEQLIKQVETEEEEDDLLDEVIQFIFEQNSASTSLLQRQFRIGYNRAARLIDVLEDRGLISGQNGSRPREVLLSRSQYEELV